MIVVVIPGRPATKGRARVSRSHAYTPSETKEAQDMIGWYFRQAIKSPLLGALKVTITFYTSNLRIDLDNAGKLVCDAGNRIAWTDDRHIWKLDTERVKVSKGSERTVVEICRWDTSTRREVLESAESGVSAFAHGSS